MIKNPSVRTTDVTPVADEVLDGVVGGGECLPIVGCLIISD